MLYRGNGIDNNTNKESFRLTCPIDSSPKSEVTKFFSI